MPSSRPRAVRPHFTSVEDGADYPAFDLTGCGQLTGELQRRLDAANELLAHGLSRHLCQLIGCDRLQVMCHPWRTDGRERPEFFLGAVVHGLPDFQVLLGFDRRCIYGLSELFFGGEPQKLNGEQLAGRPLADTELRLGTRVLDSIVKLLGPILDLPDEWRSRWLEPATVKHQPMLWCSVEVATDEWSATMVLGWPANGIVQRLEDDLKQYPDLRTELRTRLHAAGTHLKVQVATLTLPLVELSQLQVGEILSVDLGNEVAAWAGASKCFKGVLCEDGDRLALKINKVMEARR